MKIIIYTFYLYLTLRLIYTQVKRISKIRVEQLVF